LPGPLGSDANEAALKPIPASVRKNSTAVMMQLVRRAPQGVEPAAGRAGN
jgi:hypothetical protein